MKQRYKTWLFLSVLFLCSKGYSLTLSEARTEARRLLKDTATSGDLRRYPDSMFLSFFNQAQREVVTATWCLETSTGITLSVGSTYYNLPSDLINVKMVQFRDSTGRIRNITETSYKATTQSNPDYERQTGPPMQYILRASTSVSNSSYQIAFLPIPTASSTGSATINYYKQSTDLVNDTDVLLDGDYVLTPYHESVVYQVVYKIKLIEGDVNTATAYSSLYQDSLKNMNSRLGERPNLNPGFSAGGPTIGGGAQR